MHSCRSMWFRTGTNSHVMVVRSVSDFSCTFQHIGPVGTRQSSTRSCPQAIICIYSAVKLPLYIKICLNYFHFCSKRGGTQKFSPPRAARKKINVFELFRNYAHRSKYLSYSFRFRFIVKKACSDEQSLMVFFSILITVVLCENYA